MYKSFREINDDCSEYVMNIKNGIDIDNNYNLLLSEFKPIIRKIIYGLHYGGSIDRTELEQEAAVVLWKCCHTYDFDGNKKENKKDALFYTYYYKSCSYELSNYIHKYQTIFTTNHHERIKCGPLRKFSTEFHEENGRYPTHQEFIEFGFSKKLVDRFQRYNENLHNHNDDYLEKMDSEVGYDNPVELELLERDEKESLYHAIDCLDDKYRSVILLKFFNNMTDVEVGEKLGVCEKTARKRKQKAIKILKDNLMEFE